MTPFYQDDYATIYHGDCRDVLRALPDESINCCVTSPPYFGLRDYGTAQWEGGSDECGHEPPVDAPNGNKGQPETHPGRFTGNCRKCGARRIDQQIGLEQTPDEYVAQMVAVFREVRRVLRDDGTCWINLGDSYAGSWGNYGGQNRGNGKQREITSGSKAAQKAYAGLEGWRPPTAIGANLANCLHRIIEGGVVFIAGRCSLTISSEGDNVLASDHLAPDSELSPFFSVQRVFIKQRDNDFCQVLNFLNPVTYGRIGCALSWHRPSNTDLEILLDPNQSISIVVAEHDLDADPSLSMSAVSVATKDSEASLAVKESAKPITKGVTDCQSVRNAVSLDSGSKRSSQVYAIDEPVTFRDAFNLSPGGLRDFRITHASKQQFTLSCVGGAVQLTVRSVGHLYISNQFGSLYHYSELYDKAERKANSLQPKQELGIPEMVKRALMEDGWICRQTVIWHKPNPMPESVKDRCTKAHEYIFLLSKSAKYWYDAEAVMEDAIRPNDVQVFGGRKALNSVIPSTDPRFRNGSEQWGRTHVQGKKRNRRSVWTVSTKPYPESHFAVFPPDLIEPCILAGCPEGGTVLDPFLGSGTTAQVANELKRKAIGIELNPEYLELVRRRTSNNQVRLIV